MRANTCAKPCSDPIKGTRQRKRVKGRCPLRRDVAAAQLQHSGAAKREKKKTEFPSRRRSPPAPQTAGSTQPERNDTFPHTAHPCISKHTQHSRPDSITLCPGGCTSACTRKRAANGLSAALLFGSLLIFGHAVSIAECCAFYPETLAYLGERRDAGLPPRPTQGLTPPLHPRKGFHPLTLFRFAFPWGWSYFSTALMRRTPAEEDSSFMILNSPRSPVLVAWGPPQISKENSPIL